MSKLSTELHMSKHQIDGAIVTIINMLFSQEWKHYNKHKTPHLDTLPSMRNILQIECFFEAMAFTAIIEEIMEDEKEKGILNQTEFVMMDSTSHILKVFEE